jgi:Astacin (Peptidase family M12A)/Abnormal spindle-like microcephaly-assoc'd, ASPM-SPD-2-Hydin/Transmembrane protein 131-like N-terminal
MRTLILALLASTSLFIFGATCRAQSVASPSIVLSNQTTRAWETDQAYVDLEGTAKVERGIRNVVWVNQFGQRGQGSWALGGSAATWEAKNIPLRPGANLIAVTIVDTENHSESLHVAVHRTVASSSLQSSSPVLAGTWKSKPIFYQVRNGLALVEGDIVLGSAALVGNGSTALASAKQQAVQPDALSISYTANLWPSVAGVFQIPYIITGSSSNLNTALTNFNQTFSGFIQFVPRSSQSNYVNITVQGDGNEGFSNVGMAGGEQSLNCGAGCAVATWLHEMGHTVGLLHEHQRPDRASYITLNLASADLPNVPGNFTLPGYDFQNIGLFDHASIMEYGAFDFTKAGLPVIESIPPGVPLSNDTGYSAGDVDGVERLYGAAPSNVTVTTNPPGLAVIVDSVTYNTTPQSFAWTLGSSHTIAVAADPQFTNPNDGATYAFGAWNDLGAASHTITVQPGSGALTAPATKPAVTVYQANYVRLQPFAFLSPASYPTGSGSVNVVPTPLSEFGGTFFADRTLVTLTLVPIQNSGYNFYDWFNLPFPPSDNPHSFYIQAPTTQAQAVYVSDPVTIVGGSLTGPNASNPGLSGTVDGGFAFLPTGFSPTYDGTAWNAGTNHTVAVSQTQSPITTNVYYNWSSWSDAQPISHSVTQPASGSQMVTGSFTPFYASYTVPPPLGEEGSACYGGVTLSPVGVTYPENGSFDFYEDGTSVTATAAANSAFPGFVFAGWSGSLTGNSNPSTITIHDQFVPIANFNTIASPLTITGLSPASTAATSGALDITITGTGFTPSTFVNWNTSRRTSTYISATQLTLHLIAGDLTQPGGQDIFIGNSVTNSSSVTCLVGAETSFNVISAVAPSIQLSPASIAFGSETVGVPVTKPVTVTNNGTSPVSITSITVTGANTVSFQQTNDCGSSIAGASSCTIDVTFKPTGTGARSASVTLNDSLGTQNVSLTGTGVAPPISLSPASIAFGNETVGVPVAKPVTVTNNGTSAISVTSITVTGANTVSFQQTNNCGSSIAATSSCTISVTFKPTGTGARSASITLMDSIGTQNVPLTGTGVAAPITLTPTSIAFGNETVNVPVSKPITVKNNETSAIAVTSITVTGANTVSFQQTNTCGSSIPASGTCTITVTFRPTGTGARSASVTLSDSAGTQSVPLTGTGVAAPITLSPTSLAFGNETVNVPASKPVTVTNSGASTITVSSITVTGANTVSFQQTNNCGATIPSPGSCTITVTFKPTGTGARSASVTLVDSIGTQNVPLTGTGVAP